MKSLVHVVRRLTRVAILFGTLVTCAVGLVVVSGFEPRDRAVHGVSAKSQGLPVSVLEVEPLAHAAVVTALGEANPIWETTIRSQAEGRIEFLSADLEPGARIEQGRLLVGLERGAYLARVSDARSRLSAVRTELMLEERRVLEAQEDWRRSGIGGVPGSPLTLRGPQLESAQSTVEAAEAALAHAEHELGYTQIRAPFDGVVVSRAVDPGETVFAGDEVAVIYGLSAIEVGIPLDVAQWALLPEDPVGLGVSLSDPWREARWGATVVRDALRHERESRLRMLYVRVERPLEHNPPLLPGMFVRAELTGRDVPGTLCLPQSSLTKAGRVWVVDGDNVLQPFEAEPVFYGDGTVYVRSPRAGPQRVVVSPNSSFVAGMRVRPVDARSGER